MCGLNFGLGNGHIGFRFLEKGPDKCGHRCEVLHVRGGWVRGGGRALVQGKRHNDPSLPRGIHTTWDSEVA